MCDIQPAVPQSLIFTETEKPKKKPFTIASLISDDKEDHNDTDVPLMIKQEVPNSSSQHQILNSSSDMSENNIDENYAIQPSLRLPFPLTQHHSRSLSLPTPPFHLLSYHLPGLQMLSRSGFGQQYSTLNHNSNTQLSQDVEEDNSQRRNYFLVNRSEEIIMRTECVIPPTEKYNDTFKHISIEFMPISSLFNFSARSI